MDIEELSKLVSGKIVSNLAAGESWLSIHFRDGAVLRVDGQDRGLTLLLASQALFRCPAAGVPTARQREYLEFIAKYMLRYYVAPSEADILRHFMVSAPSAHQMVVTLERLGFLTRLPGVCRSIRLAEPADCTLCGGRHLMRTAPRAVRRRDGRLAL